MDTLSREYESGNSRPSYAALDRARNDLEALDIAKDQAMNAVRSALWDLQQHGGGYSDTERRDAIEAIAEVIGDLVFDRLHALKDEIDTLEVALP
jgi:hypothetical protein